jgi:PEP-CTERM motif
MNARYTVAALALTILASTASASILSATNSTAQVRKESTDYLRVDAVQNQLNASLQEKADAAASGSFAGSAPSLGSSGGFLVTTGGGATFSSSSGNHFGRGGNGGAIEWNTHFDDTRPGGRPGRGGESFRIGGGAEGTQAAPEPSTWMLLGTGLLMMGLYAGIRRRQSASM